MTHLPRSTSARSQPLTARQQLDHVLVLLRNEWKSGFDGIAATQALTTVSRLNDGESRQAIGLRLIQVEQSIEAYLAAIAADRPESLKQAAATVKNLLESLQDDRTPAAAAPPTPSPEKPQQAPVRSISRQLVASSPVTALPRVGEMVSKRLAALGVETVGDVVEMTPRRHIDYSRTVKIGSVLSFPPGEDVTIRGFVREMTSYPGPPARVQVRLSDDTGATRVTWFNPFISRQIIEGDEIAISGKPERGYSGLQFTSPDWERIGGETLTTGRLTPVYSTTQGLAQKSLRAITRAALDSTRTTIGDYLPEPIRSSNKLLSLSTAYEQAHYPDNAAALEAANNRLAFDELFLLQIGMIKLKRNRQQVAATPLPTNRSLVDKFLATLPYSLTKAQQVALTEISSDLKRPHPMNRLLQGDVGSGKTVVAAVAALVATGNDAQSAVMAPTEILAEQHYVTLGQLFTLLPDDLRPRVTLLTGSTPAKSRREIHAALASGEIDILIGTHALIQGDVKFSNLALAIVDEQHRFGVRQRAQLIAKSGQLSPHILAMTATPIPRTLNMVLNGDLDVTIIGERPPGRQPVETRRYGAGHRQEAYELVREEVATGRQVFVICPLVEESDSIVAKAAIAEAERLQRDVYPNLRVALLHGKMSGKEKDRIMSSFRNRESDILVSTSVIEVGVDIPNATVMMIEGAERFGLAQLHQFRGRVGRGADHSYCLLLAEDASQEAGQRLDMMVKSDDGFDLADKDLELRGPGDFVGTRQSGLPEMRMFARGFNSRMLNAARLSAEQLLDSDPDLAAPENDSLRQRVARFWQTAAPDLPFSWHYHQ